MIRRFRSITLLGWALLAIVVISAVGLLVQNAFLMSFIVVPVMMTSALGRPWSVVVTSIVAFILAVVVAVTGGFDAGDATRLVALAVISGAAVFVAAIVRRDRRSLARHEDRMRVLAENASDIVFRSTPETVIEWVSPSVEQELGYRPEEMVGHSLGSFLHPDDVEGMFRASREVSSRRPASYRGRFQRHDGGLTWMEINTRPVLDGDTVVGRVGSARNIDSQIRIEDELHRRAVTDELTGVIRRGEVLEHLHTLQDMRQRTGQASAVIFCDIDHFKELNDTHGHAGGDEVLRELASRLRIRLRDDDSVARFGGDEFLIVLHQIHSLRDAQRVADKLQHASVAPFHLPDGHDVRVSLSMGLTEVHDGESIAQVLARADEALYVAKDSGRDQVVSVP